MHLIVKYSEKDDLVCFDYSKCHSKWQFKNLHFKRNLRNWSFAANFEAKISYQLENIFGSNQAKYNSHSMQDISISEQKKLFIKPFG